MIFSLYFIDPSIDCHQDEEFCSSFDQDDCDIYGEYIKEECPKLCRSCDPNKSKGNSTSIQI